jgi:hypothetical protein
MIFNCRPCTECHSLKAYLHELPERHFRSQRRRAISGFLVGAAVSLSPSQGGAFSQLLLALTEESIPSTSITGVYGTPVGSGPYFSSASAARLFVNPSSTSRGSPDARRQLSRQMKLQDSRVEQCFEAGIDWEQCFFYGTDSGVTSESVAPMRLPDVGAYATTSQGYTALKRPTSKTSIPTW